MNVLAGWRPHTAIAWHSVNLQQSDRGRRFMCAGRRENSIATSVQQLTAIAVLQSSDGRY